MKKQIYSITKDNETLESELYSLADFPKILQSFCEGDTEYNYIDEMRRQKRLSITLKPVNMKGGGYSNFLEQVKTDGTTNCLAKFIIIDGD